MSDEAISNVGDAAPAAPSTTVDAVKTAGLHQMAHADDGSDYHAERRDQAAEAEGAELSTDRKAARAERYRRAVESAQQHVSEKRDASAPESATLVHALNESTGNNGQDETREQFEARIRDETALNTKFNMRAEEYVRRNPSAKTDYAVFDYLPPAPHIDRAIATSEHGPEIAHRLALNPDAINWINSLPPMEAVKVIGMVEGQIASQGSAPTPSPQRRATNAPAPMSVVRGGASPTPDLYQLAKLDDATEYHKVRQAQRKAGQR